MPADRPGSSPSVALRLAGLAALAGLLLACQPASAPAPTSPAGAALVAAPAPGSGELTVFAAASLTDAFQEIGQRFQSANPNAKVSFNFGASSQLRTQLEQGAQADVFASANQQELDRARAANAIAGPDRIFARNRLAVIVPASNPAAVEALEDLGRPGLKFVTAGPEVPIGIYTQDMLERMSQDAAYGPNFRDRVNANIVSREPNVRQVVAKISLGEADAAVVYSSDVTPDLAARVARLEVPDRFNTLASYPIAMVRNAPSAAGAEAFISYLLGADGQAVLARWGFLPAAQEAPTGASQP